MSYNDAFGDQVYKYSYAVWDWIFNKFKKPFY